MQILWLKRDLRFVDHEPLRLALEQVAAAGPVLVCYFHEPSLLARADTSAQHILFAKECLQELCTQLQSWGSDMLVLTMDAPAAFAALHELTAVTRLWAFAETTHQAGFERDQAVHAWSKKQGITFRELSQNAVLRGTERSRKKFDFGAHLEAASAATLSGPENWGRGGASGKTSSFGFVRASKVKSLRLKLLRQYPAAERDPLQALTPHSFPGWLPDAPEPALHPFEDKTLRLTGGRTAALEHLARFVEPDNLLAYPTAISGPQTALKRCSRLSPYLALGVISDREVVQALTRKLDEVSPLLPAKDAAQLLDAARFFGERLFWRSSYLQAMEVMPRTDTEGGLIAFQGLREQERMNGWLQCWASGQTGYPFVDAAMRMLNATGWLNMRLRGAVTSFALNDLWLPWQEVGNVLAREFLDYEPAIHWNQLQIHAGVARYSGPLTYDVVKQARDHDPTGRFVRQWVPELRGIPLDYLFEPWTAPASVQKASGVLIGQTYPQPLVRYPAANDAARQRVAALREGSPVPASAYWKERSRMAAMQGQSSLF